VQDLSGPTYLGEKLSSWYARPGGNQVRFTSDETVEFTIQPNTSASIERGYGFTLNPTGPNPVEFIGEFAISGGAGRILMRIGEGSLPGAEETWRVGGSHQVRLPDSRTGQVSFHIVGFSDVQAEPFRLTVRSVQVSPAS